MDNVPVKNRRSARLVLTKMLLKSVFRLLAGPVLLFVHLFSRHRRNPHQVVFYTYPKLLFAWPLIAAGFLLWPLSSTILMSPQTLGWVYAIVIVVTILTIGIDINRNTAAFWLAIIVCCWFAVLWLRDVKGLVIFSRIYQFFASLKLPYAPDAGLLVSIGLGVAFVLMVAWTRINSMWRVTHNEFEHYSLGRADDSLGRGAKRVLSEYPDLFEFCLCLAGDLIIFDSGGKRIIRRIPHIPLLPFKRHRINRILGVTLVTSEEAYARYDEEEGDVTEDAGEYEAEAEIDSHDSSQR